MKESNYQGNQICHECGKEFTTNEDGVTHHIDKKSLHNIDYDLDQDHSAY
jgi:hypothetical protein